MSRHFVPTVLDQIVSWSGALALAGIAIGIWLAVIALGVVFYYAIDPNDRRPPHLR